MTPGNDRSCRIGRIMVGGRATDYTYDDNGNIKTITDVSTGKVRSYLYDRRDQDPEDRGRR